MEQLVNMHAGVFVYVYACMRACVHACVRICVCMCVCVCGRVLCMSIRETIMCLPMLGMHVGVVVV